jgi:ribose transport system permease protein
MIDSLWQYLRHQGRPFIGLILIVILGTLLSPRTTDGTIVFLSPGNLTDVLLQQSEVGIIALAMTFVIIGSGIDLSVGSVLALSACTGTLMLMVWNPYGPTVFQVGSAIAVSLLGGALVGTLNGLIITRIGLQPFVMTLATMMGVRGFIKWLTASVNIDLGFGATPSGHFAELFSSKLFAIPLWIFLAIIAHLILTGTIYGRYLRAIGENERAAVYTGLPVRAVRLSAYIGSGILAALAGLIHAARSHQGNPNEGSGYELDAIAAVVIGGTALAGGNGSIVGTVTGTLVLGLITNVLRLHMVDSSLELIIKAVIIISAVWLQRRTTGVHGEL